MALFYVERKENEAGEHVVHSSTCTCLPAEESMRYLGAYSNPQAPVHKALDRYLKVSTCPTCLPA